MQNFVNLTADLFDKADLIWLIYKRTVKSLTMKMKPDANPYKQISDDMWGKFTISCGAVTLFQHRENAALVVSTST